MEFLKNKLSALKNLISPEAQAEEPEQKDDFFEKLRANKDARREEYSEQADSSFEEMLDTKEEVSDMVEAELSPKDKERIAQEYRDKMRRELGLGGGK